MKYLYVDNFRGFNDVLLPLKKVNFLVGENSSGKTSILALINLLSSRKFLYDQNFNTDDYEFGTFKDIASTDKKTKYFKIGFISISDSLKKSKMILMSFKEEKSLPRLKLCSYLEDRFIAHLDFRQKSVKMGVDKMEAKKGWELHLLDAFEKWTKSLSIKTKAVTVPASLKADQIPLPILLELQISKKFRKEALKTKPNLMGIDPIFPMLMWMAPIRSEPQRTYESYKREYTSEGAHAPLLIRDIQDDEETRTKFIRYVSEFGKNSDLFERLSVKSFDPFLSNSPFALEVQLDKKRLNIKSVGYGVSQCLPFVVDLFAWGNDSWYAVQQPEIHLHPKGQAALGDLIYDRTEETNKHFIIETHSDFLIDRFRLNYRKKKAKADAQVLFFKRTPSGNEVYPIDILKNGEYSIEQPEEFRSFFVKEELDLLRLR